MSEKIEFEEIAKIMVHSAKKSMNEDFHAPNFLTTIVTDKETNEQFEFTIRKHEGISPAKMIKRLENTLNKIEDILRINRRGRVSNSHTLERIERALKHYRKELYE